jgi:hypothetical protein
MTTGRAGLACHQSHVHNPNESLCRWQFHRPQSSSASRFTADASGFFHLEPVGRAMTSHFREDPGITHLLAH